LPTACLFLIAPRSLLHSIRTSSLFLDGKHTTPPHTRPLHDALPIFTGWLPPRWPKRIFRVSAPVARASSWCPRQTANRGRSESRSEEHTSELQSRFDLVCRLLLEKKNV